MRPKCLLAHIPCVVSHLSWFFSSLIPTYAILMEAPRPCAHPPPCQP